MAEKGQHPSSFVEREIRMVLVGKTGVGKSETGNTICGAGKLTQIFKAMVKAVSVTKKCQQHSFKRFEYDLQLIDVPGFCDTNRSEEDIKKEIMKCVMMSSPGIHAILFIVRIGRFTDEDKKTMERFLHCFGEEAKRFVIVVFTGKDDLEAGSGTIDKYIGDCPVELKEFLSSTSLRFIAVNNRGSDEEKEEFTKDLIDRVKNMVEENGGQCFTDEMYERCEADLREAEKSEKLEGKRQKEFEEKCKLEAAALEEQLQSQRLKMQEMEEQLIEERKKRGKVQEVHKVQEEHLRERIKAIELSVRNEEEKKRLEEKKKRLEEEKKRLVEEKKRQAEQKEAEENMRRELEKMKDFQKKQTELYDRKIEELRLEEARKQIRDKVENEDTGYVGRLWQWCGSWFQS